MSDLNNNYENEETNLDDDLSMLLNQIDEDDPVSEDIQAISQFLNDFDDEKQYDYDNISHEPTDVGDVFSDALSAVSTLEDEELEESLWDLLPDEEPEDSETDIKEDKGKKRGFFKKEKKDKKKSKRKDKKKDSSLEEVHSDEEDLVETDKKEKKKKGKKEKKKEKKAKEPEKKKEKKVKEPKKKKEKKIKAPKKKKIKNKEKTIDIIDEIEVDEGKINKFASFLIFISFGLLVLLLMIGTNIFSYSLSIKNATNYFNEKEYTMAYEEIYGTHIKDEDVEIYDKIITVMYVNKQLNSYNNYYAMKRYPDALDSLLKGLGRYDKYIELARILGIDSDLDYVRGQIIGELNNVFNLSESESIELINIDNDATYSLALYDIALQQLNE